MQLWGRSLAVAVFLQGFLGTLVTLVSGQLTLEEIARRYTTRTPGGGIHVPILRWGHVNTGRNFKRGPVGLGDIYDLTYSALVTINGTTIPVVVDTGSSDLWVISDACQQGCSGTVKPYPQSTLRSAGIGVSLSYLDTTYASGLVGFDTVSLGGINLTDQSFFAANRTNTSLTREGLGGIMGLGFPINSLVAIKLFTQQRLANSSSGVNTTISARELDTSSAYLPLDPPSGPYGFRRRSFPFTPEVLDNPSPSARLQTRQSTASPDVVQTFIDSWIKFGSFVPRLVLQKVLQPLITITLQRDTMELGGNLGMLSIGELPSTVKSSDLTWVYLRNYTTDLGGLPGPTSSPNEVYPLGWEIMIDNVYLDGKLLPPSTLPAPALGVSAVFDTGSSYLHAPEDVVASMRGQLGPGGIFDCAVPHNLTFEIEGKMFPIDPLDFATTVSDHNINDCEAAIATMDPPRAGDYLFSWVLGDPFLKSVLSSYYFGNMSYPSQDAPKMGLLSTVPSDAGDRMKAAAAAAIKAGGFPAIQQAPPSVVPSPKGTDAHGVPQASIPTASPTVTVTRATASTNTSDNILHSGDSNMVCSSLSCHLSLTVYVSLVVVGWNIGLW